MALSPLSSPLNDRQNREPDQPREIQPLAEPGHPAKFIADVFPFQARDPPAPSFHPCFPWLDTPSGRRIAGRFPPPTKKVA